MEGVCGLRAAVMPEEIPCGQWCAEESCWRASVLLGLRICGSDGRGDFDGGGLRCGAAGGWVAAIYERGRDVWISLRGGAGEVRDAGCKGDVGERLGTGGSLSMQRSRGRGGDGGVFWVSEGQI